MMRRTILSLLLLSLAACTPQGLLSRSTPDSLDSGIQGQVLIGPMCPVVRQGQECPDQPHQATLTVLDASGKKKIAQFETDTQGRFRVALKPGNYRLHSESPDVVPYAPEQTFTVSRGEYTQITVSYDSGIR
jgi:hypothetical protein